jgi:hypothetical protein
MPDFPASWRSRFVASADAAHVSRMKSSRRILPILIGVGVALALVPPAAGDAVRRLAEPEVVDGIPCEGRLEMHPTGRVKSAVLSREHEIAGNLLPAGTQIVFYEDGRLRNCRLRAAGAVLSGRPLPKGTLVWFDGGGRMRNCLLPEDTLIEGHLCRGKGDNWSTGFYPNGQLRLAWLARDEEIQGVPCLAAAGVLRTIGKAIAGREQGAVSFHPNGNLAAALVSRECAIQGRAFKRGELIRLDRDGNVQP